VPVQAQIILNPVTDPTIASSTNANPDGTYAIWAPAGHYDVRVLRNGWISQVERRQITAGATDRLDFTLLPSGGCNESAGGL
jgi:hypothetical protein